ncbi:MAG TPA: ATP-dependent DNA ligase [Candidatus Eisenbacteria bacterium]|nr:ATP-dependent DNA ligase [Candidatus Eisenbacteria bacterium]
MNFSLIVDTFEQMEQTSSRLALTDYLVSLLKITPSDIIDKVIYLIQGKLYPDYEGIELGLAGKMAIRILAYSSGLSIAAVEEIYRKTGDLGDTASEVMKSKNQTTLFADKMTVERVYLTLDRIARTVGSGSQEVKLRLVSSLLSDATSRESRYIMKFVMGTLRLGIADYTVMDALALAFTGDKSNRKILENAYNVSSDLGTVAKLLATKGLESIRSLQITLYKPIRPMLAERVRTAEEALERMDGRAAVEYKLDGERIQVHKGKGKVELFSRRLEKITDHYPDVAEAIKSINTEEAILEAEVVAINPLTDEFLPFQELMHRRRKYDIKQAMENYPVVMNFFDVLYMDGDDKTSLTYLQRRKLIKKIIQGSRNEKTRLVPQIIVEKSEQIDKFMASAIENGCEGLMIKQLKSTYRAGNREFAWVKLKREYRSDLADTLDLVIVGALYGRGRRVGKYGALLLAAYDSKSDVFRSTCKVGAGFTDQHLEQFLDNLETHLITHRHARVDTGMEMDVWFEPKIVIEVIASEITLSPSHTAAINSIRQGFGLALRFPKFTGKIRYDKKPEDATDVEELVSMYKQQMRAIKTDVK